MEKSVSSALRAFDDDFIEKYGVICGVDEAGRGPLAGDVYAAAVILKPDFRPDGLNDSKKISEKKRNELFDIIIRDAVSYSVATASIEEIEQLNIGHASLLAMKRAVDGLSVKPDYVLIDGNAKPKLEISAETVVKGDGKSASIAAASILAKVSRDRYMSELAIKYPEYLFEKHKGYATKLHYAMLEKHGISEVHRKSFLKRLVKC